MYQNRHGRFTAPDPLLASASAANPQTFNRYIYTGNNPVNITDPSGLTWCRTGLESGSVKWIEGACGSGYPYSVDDSLQFCNNASGCSIPTRTGGTSGTVEYGVPIWFDSGGTAYEVTNPTPVQAAQIAQLSGAQNLLETQTVASASASELGTTMNQRHVSEVSLGCPVSVSSCKSSSSPGYQRLDTANASKPNTVKGIEIALQVCSMAPVVGMPCSGLLVIAAVGSGDVSTAGEELLLGTLPGSKLLKQADKAADVAKGAHAVYHGVDAAGVVRYVGITSRGVATRADEHLSAIGTGKEFLRYEVVKGAQGLTKMQARIWEQRLILEHGLGKYGGTLLNKRNEIAEKYWTRYGINP